MFFRTQAFCALAAAGLMMGLAANGNADSLKVKTEQGKVAGKTINDGKVRAFMGLPYAAPPVGDMRWKAPQPPAKWKGERDATKYRSALRAGTRVRRHGVSGCGAERRLPFPECLHAGRREEGAKLPVMFWIHGGGYSGGASSEPRHNGDFLPLKGVVLVTINYRLGVFGFLVTDELAKENNGVAGNYGLMDMVAALQWVKSNIGEFGGDQNNVTIFGESAGSFAVSTLMASPMAQGLFAKAIGESGAAFPSALNLGGQSVTERAAIDGKWVATLGVKDLAGLRAMPTDKILDAAKTKGATGFAPDIDGKFLTEPVPDTYAAGKQAHVPLLAGWNADEGSFMAMRGMTAPQWKEMANKLFADRAEAFLKLYPGETDAQALRSAVDFGSDQFIAFGTWKWLEAHRKTGDAPVYRYHFELAALPSKYHPGTFAFHSDDIEYVFGTLDTRPGETVRPEDRQLSEAMMTTGRTSRRTAIPMERACRHGRSTMRRTIR